MNTANEIKIVTLKSKIAIGIKDLARGNFQTYDDAEQLVDNIRQRGRIRLNALRLKVAAKVQGKKK